MLTVQEDRGAWALAVVAQNNQHIKMSRSFISGGLWGSFGSARHHPRISCRFFDYLTHCLGDGGEAVWENAHDIEFILLHFAKPIRLRMMLCCGGFSAANQIKKPFLTNFDVHLPHLDFKVRARVSGGSQLLPESGAPGVDVS